LSSRPVARRPTPPPAEEPPKESPPAASNQRNSVQLGPRDRLIGQLYIEGDLRVGGVVEGEVEATGDVEIDDMAKVKASLAGRDVSIRGQVNGAIVARKRLVVARSGSLFGDVRVQRLIIQDGATFSGKVSMGAAAAEAPTKPIESKPVAPEPEVQAVVEAPAPIVAAPIIAPPATDGKGKAVVPPKASAPKASAPRVPAPKAAPQKGKPKRR
jgi:cytoskeletal protein CcmA (bactofilin family)